MEPLYVYTNKVLQVTDLALETGVIRDILIKDENGKIKRGTLEWVNYKPIAHLEVDGIGNLLLQANVINKPTKKKVIRDYTNKLLNGIHLDFPNIEPQFKTITKKEYVPGKYLFYLVKGLVQSGKTNFIIGQSLVNWFAGTSTLIIVRNMRGDMYQLIRRLRTSIEALNKNIGDLDYNIEDINISLVTRRNLRQVSASPNPTIMIALANSTQLQTVFETIEENNDLLKKVVVIIDEVDFIDTEKSNATAQLVLTLKQYSKAVIGISATVLDSIIQEGLSKDQIKFLLPPLHYKGISQIEWHDLTIPMVDNREQLAAAITSKEIANAILDGDPNLAPFLKKLTTWTPIHVEGCLDEHPIMYLIRMTPLKKQMCALQDYIVENHGDNVTSIVYDGEGVRLYSPEITNVINVGNCTFQDGYCKIKKVGISEVIGYLKTHGGSAKFPRIVIIAGHVAGRGISFVSDDYRNGVGWHIIGEYLKLSRSTRQPEATQSVRLVGIINDCITLRMYVTPELKVDLLKAHHLAEELLDRGLKSDTDNVAEAIESLEITRQKMSARKITRTKPLTLNLVDHHDGGVDLSEYCINANHSKILRINENAINGAQSRKVYALFVDAFCNEESGIGMGVWRRKASVLSKITSDIALKEQYKNISHHWHTDTTKFTTVKNDTASGLLFKQESGNVWLVCYN